MLRHVTKHFDLFGLALALIVVVIYGGGFWLLDHELAGADEPIPYITIESLDLTFTEREYHQRVQRQIEEQGWEAVCVMHLLSLAPTARTYDVYNARMNLVLVEECADGSSH